MSLRWLLWSFLSPSQLLLVAVVIGTLLLLVGRRKHLALVRAGLALCTVGGSGVLIFGFLPLSHYAALALEERFPRPALPPQVDGIILLSGAERPAASDAHGEPQLNAHASRYVAALRLAARYPHARVVYTGGPRIEPGKGPLGTQTAVAAAILASMGPDPARLAFEERSRDTCDNASFTRALVRPQAGDVWVVVTSAMHMPRTMACFRAVGWEVIPYATDFQVVRGAWDSGSFRVLDNLEILDSAAHEWIGLAYYRWVGRTREFFPAPIDRPAAYTQRPTREFDPSDSAP